MNKLIKLLADNHISDEELTVLMHCDGNDAEQLRSEARKVCDMVYGKEVFLRGLIEISNICKNDCLYCGIRRSNEKASRYRLTEEQIISCCDKGYSLGLRTFVLQGGEDGFNTDEYLTGLIRKIKAKYPDCAVTLSLGERTYESYRALREAGADRYLLRHETASKTHYELLHPQSMSFDNRMECLHNLKALGYQTGCGFMVGSPYQTDENIISDLRFIQSFKPQMAGIGPFIPHKDTPFSGFPSGSTELTLNLLAIIRIMLPQVLLPATTALGTVQSDGRERGILSGANVIMPNLTPADCREKYLLYNNKLSASDEAEAAKEHLEKSMNAIGYRLSASRGDYSERIQP